MRYRISTFVLAAWALSLLGKDAAGAKTIEGGVDYLPYGSGSRELVDYAAGKAKPAVLVADLKNVLPREQTPPSVTLWRL